MPLPGCLEEFDIIADKLMTASDAGKVLFKRKSLILEAKKPCNFDRN